MPPPRFDRSRVKTSPLRERVNRCRIEADQVSPDAGVKPLSVDQQAVLGEAVERIRAARRDGRPVILAFGAHTIKNGLAPVLIRLMRDGWLTHLASNGAGIIHDWEFAYLGESSEHVEENMRHGQFGLWEDTLFNINLALNVGSWRGLGYGESIGALIHHEGVDIPPAEDLRAEVRARLETEPAQAAAAADLLAALAPARLPAGPHPVPHPWKRFSVQAAAYELGIPFTGHPMFGHDIIYNHPLNHGACLGRAAERDYLAFAESVSRLDGGVFISMGSAVMAPMIFEKAMALAQNIALQRGALIDRHFILVVDLAPSSWDWNQGEPPENHPEYYLRYNKSFRRMGGTMRYLSADNREFLLHACQALKR
jgi:hypothetical protein